MNADGHALHWPGRVLAEEDLRRNLNGHRAVILAPGAVVTPSAREHLHRSGVRLDRPESSLPTGTPTWGYAQDRQYPFVGPAVVALVRDGLCVIELPCAATDLPCHWSHAVAACMARGDCRGGAVFCEDPGLVCCVANKVPGIRAVAVTTVSQAARATRTLNANLLAVEMPGRTYFEVRQILRTLCASATTCPDDVAHTLRELDGHAHR
jgi:ribose 5-phosphate isomerase RpiB